MVFSATRNDTGFDADKDEVLVPPARLDNPQMRFGMLTVSHWPEPIASLVEFKVRHYRFSVSVRVAAYC